jgi:nucleotide sugar dehydrogenase
MRDEPTIIPADESVLANLQTPAGPPTVCIQGLGFVGAAVSIAVASSRTPAGYPAYNVIGVDLPTEQGRARIAALNRGEFPFPMADARLAAKAREARQTGNLVACANPEVFGKAEVVIVDVPLDVIFSADGKALDLSIFRAAVATLARYMQPDALVIIETTVPPGATERIVLPALRQGLAQRGLPDDRFRLAHCYERVMPGANYFDSIVNMPRVYAGIDPASAEACEAFLRTMEDPKLCPATRLSSTTASELGKVLENTYRAVTIGLMEEFTELAEEIGVDLFEVVESIRPRPTHSNIRSPGFGVGGYCLTKDPLLPGLAAKQLFNINQPFPFASLAIEVNQMMPRRIVWKLKRMLGGELAGKRIILLGLSYRPEVGDTRCSPSYTFVQEARAEGAELLVHDPMVRHWDEMDLDVPEAMPAAAGSDAVVLAVPHQEYKCLDYAGWVADARPVFLDGFNVLTTGQRQRLRGLGCRVESIGRGHGL